MATPLPMSKTTLRLWVNGGMVALFLAGTLFAFWPFINASREMRGFCDGLKPGQTAAQVRQQAAAMDYELTVAADGNAELDDVRSGGRRSCQLRFGPQGLVSAVYAGS